MGTPRNPESRGERIMFHLLQHHRSRASLVAPHGVTQEGIASRTRIARPNVSRALSELEAHGLVESRIGPVEGEGRYKKVYFLSNAGAEAARRHPGSMGGHVSHPPVLPWPRLVVGRDAELGTTSQWLRGDGPPMLIVHGMAGIGKTTLILRSIDRARGALSTFYLRIAPWLTPKGLFQELSAFLALHERTSLSSFVATQGREDGALDIGSAAFSFRRDLEGLKCLIALDDYHEADLEVESAVRAIAEGVEGSGTRLMLGSRSLRAPADVRATRTGRAVDIELGGLDPEAIGRLLEVHRPERRDAETLARLHRATAGNPLFVLLVPDPAEIARPGEVREYLKAEFHDRLPAAERDLLARMSVFRGDIPAASVDRTAGEGVLSSLMSRGLVHRESDGGFTVHETLREFYRSAAGPGPLSEAHLAAARFYASASDPSALSERVWHLAQAGKRDDLTALLKLEGERLLAAGHLRELIAAADASAEPRSPEMRLLRGQARAALGEIKSAEEELSGALPVEAAQTRAYCLRLMGEFAEAERVLKGALRILGSTRPTKTRSAHHVRLEIELGNLIAARGDPAAIRMLRRCLTESERGADRMLLADCERALATAYTRGEQEPKAIPHFERAAALYRRLGETRSLAITMNNVSAALLAEGQLSGSLEAAAATMRAAEECGDRMVLVSAHINAGLIKLEREQRAEAIAYGEKAKALALELGNRRLAAMACALAADAALHMGDLGRAEPLLAEATEMGAGGEDVMIRSWILRMRALQHRIKGDTRRCDELLDEAERLARDSRLPGQRCLATLARIENLLDQDRAREASMLARKTFRSTLWPHFDPADRARLLEVHGVAETVSGQRKNGRRLLLDAARYYDGIGAPLPAERCRAFASGGKRHEGSRDPGRSSLRGAYLLHESGAVLAQWMAPDAGDSTGPGARDMLGEVLTILQAMMRETMGLPAEETVRSISFGGSTILMEAGLRCSLVADFVGEEPPWARRRLKRAMDEIMRAHQDSIASWDGDLSRLAGANKLLERLSSLES